MKKILTIVLILISFSIKAQYSSKYNANYTSQYKFKDIAIQSGLLVTTFATVETLRYNGGSTQTATVVAFTGMATTIVVHYVIKGVKKNTPHKLHKHRIKKLSRL